MPSYDATPEWLRKHELTGRDATKLLRALCILADYEGKVKDALGAQGHSPEDHSRVCGALRYLVDGE